MEQYTLPQGTFSCLEQKNGRYCIAGYEGKAGELSIPSQMGAFPVSAIGKKAFWGNSYLRHVLLPDTIEEVGDWAFSGCSALHTVKMNGQKILFGNHVFQKTEHLREISFAGSSPAVNRLLAAAVTILGAEYLLDPLAAGTDSWYHSLDARILTFIKESEDSVLKELVYCAEEDMMAKQEACLRKQAHEKARIAFLRLAYSDKIADDMFEELAEYLRRRTIGCAEQTAWEVVRETTDDQKSYCDILLKTGAIHTDNFQKALDDLGEEAVELKAYLLKKKQDRIQKKALWESLEL
ncbi:MAG: leucine-rich repeat domain-containing protein [Ruminococcus sp.]|nr:leucine-rich repeat domain-containing protein [Ruminococcus sp.]